MNTEQLESLRYYLRRERDLAGRLKVDEDQTELDKGFWEGKEDQAEETLVVIEEILRGLSAY